MSNMDQSTRASGDYSGSSSQTISAKGDVINDGVIIRDMKNATNVEITGTKKYYNIKEARLVVHDYAAFKLTASIPQHQGVFSVPLLRNTTFSGRDNLLEELHEELFGTASEDATGQDGLRSCLVSGSAGIGKTQVALEYCYRYCSSYDLIFWLQAEDDEKLSMGMEGIVNKLELPKSENMTRGAIIEGLQGLFQRTDKRWLLVFDNAEDSATLEPFWPRTTHGSVIVTSQHESMLGEYITKALTLKPLDKSEGQTLLLKHFKKYQDNPGSLDEATELSEELGGMPLALTHIAGYMTISKVSMTAVLSKLKNREQTAKLFEYKQPPSVQYNKSLANVWDFALGQLDDDARAALEVLSMLDADEVSYNLLFGDGQEPNLACLKSADPESITINLRNRQLVTVSDITGKTHFSTHRTLQKKVQKELDESNRLGDVFREVFTLLRTRFPRQSPIQFPQNDNWEVCAQYSTHVMSLRRIYESSDRDRWVSIEFAELLGDVANYFWERNFYAAGLQACQTAESICRQIRGFSRQKADIYTLYGSLLEHCGISNRDELGLYHDKALQFRQQYMNQLSPRKATKEDANNYANAWHNASIVLMDRELYSEALNYQELAVLIRNSIGEHPNNDSQSHLYRSLALTAMGKTDQALELVHQVQAAVDALPEEVLRTVSVALLPFQFHWAEMYLAAGEIETAHERMAQVLKLRSEYFGVGGRSTLDTYYLTAIIEWKRENMDEAEMLLRKALKLERPQEWIEEAVARTQFCLGKLLHAKGAEDEADAYLKLARETKNRLWKQHAGYLPDGPVLEEEAVYDHMVPFGAGRSVWLDKGITRKTSNEMDKICLLLKERLTGATAEGRTLSPSEFIRLMKYNDFPGLEETGGGVLERILRDALWWFPAFVAPVVCCVLIRSHFQ